jgi:hypothetical protein
MSRTREARIERIVRLRDERLKQAVRALEEGRLLERKAAHEFAVARSSREQAETARRDLISVRADILDFIEAEEWLSSRSIVEELAARRLQKLRAQLERLLARVNEAAVKVRQLEQLQMRLEKQRLDKQNRLERALEDEVGQRVAQSTRGQR